ncbi:unnamed protein product, partial [Durusdinium trenchii]
MRVMRAMHAPVTASSSCLSQDALRPAVPGRLRALLFWAFPRPSWADRLSLHAAAALVASAGATWRRQVGQRRLYRGESVVSPTWLQPPADLLEESTYGDPLAVKYFEWLGQELQKRPDGPRVQRGHLGGDREQAGWKILEGHVLPQGLWVMFDMPGRWMHNAFGRAPKERRKFRSMRACKMLWGSIERC